MRKIATAILLGAGLMAAPAAHAQSWGVYVGNAPGYDRYGRGDWQRGDGGVCSGQRAHALEAKLRHEYRENEISDWEATRMQRQIDRLEQKQYRECREGDWRAVQRISFQFDQIDRWIEQRAHGGWDGD
ncbi:MAG: histidine kinase [Croceibacterium sp.]